MGTPPTPIPAFMCTGMVASAVTGLTSVQARAVFQASDFGGVHVHRRPEDRGAGGGAGAELAERPLAGQPRARRYSSSPCMPSTSSAAWPISTPMSGHVLAHPAHGAQRGQQVGVAGGAGGVEVQAVDAGGDHRLGDAPHVVLEVLDRLELRRAGLVDPAQRHELRPVGRWAVRLRVAAQVRHGAVVERHHRLLLRVLEHLRLEREDGAHRLVRVVVVPELDHVGAVVVLVDDLLERPAAPMSALPEPSKLRTTSSP